MTFPLFLQGLRRATTAHDLRRCILQYRALDWFSPGLYVPDIPTTKVHCCDPHIRTYSFSDFEQSVRVDAGMVSMLDGQTRVSGRILHLNEVLVLEKESSVESIRPYSTLLHVSIPPWEQDALL